MREHGKVKKKKIEKHFLKENLSNKKHMRERERGYNLTLVGIQGSKSLY